MAAKLLLILTSPENTKRSLRRIAEMARKQNLQLKVTNCDLVTNSEKGNTAHQPAVEKSQSHREILTELVEQLSDKNVSLISEIASSSNGKAIARLTSDHDICLVFYPVDATQQLSSPEFQFAQVLQRSTKCDLLIEDFGTSDTAETKRIIVPMHLAGSSYVIKKLFEFGTKLAPITPLHFSPDFGEDSQKIAESELELQLTEANIGDSPEWIRPEVVMADGFYAGLLEIIRENDTIIIGGSSLKMLHNIKVHISTMQPHIAASIAVGFFRPATLAAKTPMGQFARRIKAAVPELTLADRISLFDRIQAGARLTSDFVIMIGLSVLIASFGLLVDNSSVVIGAMLVAPFMTPLVAIGLSLAQGNLSLMKRSSLAMGAGILLGLLLSFTVAVFVPLGELTLEILARGDPDIVDMGIAFVSGMAGAYAVARKSVSEAIVGVAIAAALVPPLSCIGIMLSHGYLPEAEGAAILLATNLAAIVLGAALVFHRIGVPGTRAEYGASFKIRRVSTSLVLLLILLSIPLIQRLEKRLEVGQTRPMNFRVSKTVRQAIEDRVDSVEGLNIVFIGRSGSGRSRRIKMLLSSTELIPESVIDDIEADIQAQLKEPAPVQVEVFQNAVILGNGENSNQ